MRKLALLVIVALVLGAVIGTVSYCATGDALPPEDGDLRVWRLDIPDDENAFTYFSLAAEQVYWPEDEEADERIWALLDDELWDEDLVHELLERNAEALEYLKQGLARSECQVPVVKGVDDPLAAVSEWRTLALFCSLRARRLLKQGRDREAADEAMRTVKFGHMIQGARGCLIHYMVGSALKALGVERLRGMVSETTLEPHSLNEYARELGAYRADEEGLADAWRVEYTIIAALVDDMAAGRIGLADLTGGGGASRTRGYTGHFFKPNETKRIFANAFRTYIENVPRTYAERDYAALPDWVDDPGSFSTASVLVRGNGIGRMLITMLMPAFDRAHEEKCRTNVSIAVTQVFLALKAYKLETGHLPESLGQLVPDYLPAVPLDDFDGQPIRYSREKRIVYSVAEDLTDSGGFEGEDPWDMADFSFSIEF